MYLIRHCPTEWNTLARLQGLNNLPISPLTDEDLIAIEKNKHEVESLVNPKIITSELIRTQQTAIAYGFDKFSVDPTTNELDFGPYEGRGLPELINETGAAWLSDPRSLVLGERMVDFEARLFEVLERYQSAGAVILFGHGAVIRGLCAIAKSGNISGMNSITVPNNQMIIM
ncbi:histidine phosphatase family protein [Burkholderiaceae bacterium]|nr:histidine phosphatase family protein [Burkholderiaceae bacterium]